MKKNFVVYIVLTVLIASFSLPIASSVENVGQQLELSVGDCDGFEDPFEPTYPSQTLLDWIDANYAGTSGSRDCDESRTDQVWAHTFDLSDVCGPECCIEGATLEITISNEDGINENDGFNIGCIGSVSSDWDIHGRLDEFWGIEVGETGTIVIDIDQEYPMFFAELNYKCYLDIFVQDDSAVDCAILTIDCCDTWCTDGVIFNFPSNTDDVVLCGDTTVYAKHAQPSHPDIWEISDAYTELEQAFGAQWLWDEQDGHPNPNAKCIEFCQKIHVPCSSADARILYTADDEIEISVDNSIVASGGGSDFWKEVHTQDLGSINQGDHILKVEVCDGPVDYGSSDWAGAIWCLQVCCPVCECELDVEIEAGLDIGGIDVVISNIGNSNCEYETNFTISSSPMLGQASFAMNEIIPTMSVTNPVTKTCSPSGMCGILQITAKAEVCNRTFTDNAMAIVIGPFIMVM